MKRAITVAILLLVLGRGALFAGAMEEGVPAAYEEYPQALGFQYGDISATGLSYQKLFDRTGFQLTGGIIYIPYNEATYFGFPESTLDYAVGSEVQYRVYGEDFATWLSGQLYIFAGLKHRGHIPVTMVQDGYNNPDVNWVEPVYSVGEFRPVLGLGAGIGIEIILFRHFSIPVELGYGVDWSPLAGALADQFNVNLRPQVGFRYRY